MKTLYSWITGLGRLWMQNIERHPFGWTIGFALFIAFGSILEPIVTGSYVRVHGSPVLIRAKCVPRSMLIETRKAYDKPLAVQVLVGALDGAAARFPLMQVSTADDGRSTTFMMPDSAQAAAFAEAKKLKEGSRIDIHLTFQVASYIDVKSVSLESAKGFDCSSSPLEGAALASSIGEGAKVMWFVLMQERISDVVKLANDLVGNVVLTIMFVWSMWLLFLVIQGMVRARAWPDDRVRALYQEHLALTPKDMGASGAFRVTNAVYGNAYRILSFARVLGPALGFLLTVSSLIAGLHPSERVQQDSAAFVSSLQIALTATALGLIMRILAEWGIRAYRELADRMAILESGQQ